MIIAYTYPPELLKYSQRAKGVGIAQSVGFAFSFLNLYTTPIALAKITWKYYAINAAWDVVILAVIMWLFVETKGKTLEQIDMIFEGVTHSGADPLGCLHGEALDGKLITEDPNDLDASAKPSAIRVKDTEID